MMKVIINQKHQFNSILRTNIMLASFVAPCDYNKGEEGWLSTEYFSTIKLS